MREPGATPAVVSTGRSGPVYMAHGYLTKVPVEAITPFIEAFTEPGDTVVDPFAGSGMTGVAAAATGRRAVLYDISVLGRHIGTNYVNLVDPAALRAEARRVAAAAAERVGDVYGVKCSRCAEPARLAKAIWTVVYACAGCGAPVNYYAQLEAAEWDKKKMSCAGCAEPFTTRTERLGEQLVADVVSCSCAPTQVHQDPSAPLAAPNLAGLSWPDEPIGEDRQMFRASALRRNGLDSTAKFFSQRNLAVLAALVDEVRGVSEPAVRDKLMFAFAGVLARASKRYQWSRKRPLNAANQNYYVAPVFYEWNVFDLLTRKVEALIRSDDWLREHAPAAPDVDYRLRSAHELDLPDQSVDFVFTDPPFGSNIFHSDMNLFQEAWLGRLTDPSFEAVVDRATGSAARDAGRYEDLLSSALSECARVLKPGGWVTLVFSNSRGEVWSLLQRAIASAGFVVDPDRIAVLDKGQRSVKGQAGDIENVVTSDLVLCMRKNPAPVPSPQTVDEGQLASILDRAGAADAEGVRAATPGTSVATARTGRRPTTRRPPPSRAPASSTTNAWPSSAPATAGRRGDLAFPASTTRAPTTSRRRTAAGRSGRRRAAGRPGGCHRGVRLSAPDA